MYRLNELLLQQLKKKKKILSKKIRATLNENNF